MKVAVIGTGYVGLVTAVVLAELGHDVVGIDRDESRLCKLRAGISPIFEPGLEDLLKRTQRERRLTFSSCIEDGVCDREVVFIAVGTPARPDGSPDLSAVREVAADIARVISTPVVVVVKSTVPVGTGDQVEQWMRDAGAEPGFFQVVSNPEFLREGSAIRDTRCPDRIVIGAKSAEAAATLERLYVPLAAPIIFTDRCSAELIKYGANSFLAMKISFINAISRICELSGADVADVARGIGTDTRIGPDFLSAGLGWGGSCFPKDVSGLLASSNALGYDFGLMREVIAINDSQTHHFLDRVEARLGGFQDRRVGVLGLAFKPNTDDIREAKSLTVLRRVLDWGGQVVAYDPVAARNMARIFPEVTYTASPAEVADGADALVLITEWNEFRELDLAELALRMARPILFDGRRLFSRAAAEAAGFEYHTVGSLS